MRQITGHLRVLAGISINLVVLGSGLKAKQVHDKSFAKLPEHLKKKIRIRDFALQESAFFSSSSPQERAMAIAAYQSDPHNETRAAHKMAEQLRPKR